MTNPAPDWIQSTPSAPAIHTDRPDADSAFTTPFTPAALVQIGIQLVEGFLAKVVSALTGGLIPGVSAFVQLSGWAVTTLPAMILAPLQSLISLLVTVLGSFPIVGNVVTDLASAFGLLHDNTTTAQVTGDTAQSTAESALALASQTAAQVAAGANMSYTDGFGRTTDPSGQSTLGAEYSRDADSGSGVWGVDGAGNAHATSGGATAQEFRDRNTAAVFATDKQAGSVILSTVPQAAGGFATYSCRIGISLREDAAGTTKVVGYNDSGVVEIGYYLTGTYHQLGTHSVTQANGDLFEFRAGAIDPGTGLYDDYCFEILINNHSVYTVVDSGHASQKGVGGGFEYGGLIARLGTVVVGFFTIQTAAPDVQIFNLFDRT